MKYDLIQFYQMLNSEEIVYFFLISFAFWIFPFLVLVKSNRRVLVTNFLVQIGYSLVYAWLLEEYGSEGSSLLWIFYWFITLLGHLVGLNIWVAFYRKKQKRIKN